MPDFGPVINAAINLTKGGSSDDTPYSTTFVTFEMVADQTRDTEAFDECAARLLGVKRVRFDIFRDGFEVIDA